MFRFLNVIIRLFNKRKKPVLSVIVAFYNMEREAPRTLYTLSAKYQLGVLESDYEVLVVDCGSDNPLQESMVRKFGPQFRLFRRLANPSPAASINYAATKAKGNLIMVCIDGARMLSPGILSLTMASFRGFQNPVVATLSMHLGPEIQRLSILKGYNQDQEDQLLEQSGWQDNGYALFNISTPGESGRYGWFRPLHESGCLTLYKTTFKKLGGFSEQFTSPGGGLVNLDFYKRAVEYCEESIVLLGEGTFHQIHGGVATNSLNTDVVNPFLEEYIRIRHTSFSPPIKVPVLVGSTCVESRRLLYASAEKLLNNHSI